MLKIWILYPIIQSLIFSPITYIFDTKFIAKCNLSPAIIASLSLSLSLSLICQLVKLTLTQPDSQRQASKHPRSAKKKKKKKKKTNNLYLLEAIQKWWFELAKLAQLLPGVLMRWRFLSKFCLSEAGIYKQQQQQQLYLGINFLLIHADWFSVMFHLYLLKESLLAPLGPAEKVLRPSRVRPVTSATCFNYVGTLHASRSS